MSKTAKPQNRKTAKKGKPQIGVQDALDMLTLAIGALQGAGGEVEASELDDQEERGVLIFLDGVRIHNGEFAVAPSP